MSKYSSYFYTGLIIILTAFMLINPRETVIAASLGFQLWYATVLPALFPFFIVAELLVALGFINVLGIWLEPIMRPIFRLPGCSSLVVVMGFTSGFPVGAILTRKLYDKQMLTAGEAERLVSFTNNSSPLFIVGAIGVGMFASPMAGYLLAAAHYLSNLLLGLLMGFCTPKNPSVSSISCKFAPGKQKNAPDNIDSMGKILGDSIKNSLHNIMAVGGFIVIFSVLTRMLSYWGFIDMMAAGLVRVFSFLHLSYPLAYGLSMGFFEITMGAKTAISANDSSSLATLMVVSSILAFSGLSIIAQIMSIVSGTPIRLSFYLMARTMQIMLSLAITCLTYKLFLASSISAIGLKHPPVYKILYSFNAWTFSLYSMLVGAILIIIMLGVAWRKN
ncbi:MAG: hypothetical protein PHF24_03840 [Syntrophomonas sp.]|nr:hypothetical protein [Syntrophomonas sp.]